MCLLMSGTCVSPELGLFLSPVVPALVTPTWFQQQYTSVDLSAHSAVDATVSYWDRLLNETCRAVLCLASPLMLPLLLLSVSTGGSVAEGGSSAFSLARGLTARRS